MATNADLIKEVAAKQLDQAVHISNLTNKVDNLEKGVQRILFILEDDKGTGESGLVAKVRAVEKANDEMHEFKTNLEGKIWAFGVVGGMVSGVLIWIIKLFVETKVKF